MIVTLRFNLPEDRADLDAALLGGDALMTLWDIDQKCRGFIKHEYTASQDAQDFAQEVIGMIDGKLLES